MVTALVNTTSNISNKDMPMSVAEPGIDSRQFLQGFIHTTACTANLLYARGFWYASPENVEI